MHNSTRPRRNLLRSLKELALLVFLPHKSVRGQESFNLVRYFSIISLFFMLLAAFSLGSLYRYIASKDLIQNEEADNVKLTRLFSTTLWDENLALFMSLRGKSGDEVRANLEIQKLLSKTQQQLKDTSLLKIKIYNTDGLTLFSTAPEQIGDDKSMQNSFKQAVKGAIISNVSFRDKFYSVDKELQKLEVLASYIPVYDSSNQINGVFELYSDITELQNKITDTQEKVVLGVILIMSLLYSILLLIMRRAAAVINQQEKMQKAIEKKMQHQVHHDPLTGLPNRRYFHDLLANYMNNAVRYEHLIALLFIDLDNFKTINDTYGHDNGDFYLRTVSERLQKSCRDTDITARLSGDEFVIILGNINHVDNIDVALKRILKNTNQPINLGGEYVDCGISIGVSIYPFSDLSHDDFLRMADSAMYQAKKTGRNTYQYYSHALTEKEEKRKERANQIKVGVENNEFILHYQPRVDLHSGSIVGVEALIRWQHPTQGLIPPIEFIPLAEETGDIIDIGRYVIKQACSDICELDDNISISINLSVKQFEDPFLLSHLKDVLSQHRLTLSDVEIEITESILMKNVHDNIKLLTDMRDLGLKIALDDFGTGYSSLSYLRKLPIDYVKIDKSFVTDIDDDKDAFALISAITDLAHQLKLRVVAEGVESVSELAKLRLCGVDEVQGFLYSKPVPFAELKKIVAKKYLGSLLDKHG